MLVLDAGMDHVPVVGVPIDLAGLHLAAHGHLVGGGGVPVAALLVAHLDELDVGEVGIAGVDQLGVHREQLGVKVVVHQHLGRGVGDGEGELVDEPGL